MKLAKIKQIRKEFKKLDGIHERMFDLSEKEKVEKLKSVNWILDNADEVLGVQLLNVENEHQENIKFLNLLKALLGSTEKHDNQL